MAKLADKAKKKKSTGRLASKASNMGNSDFDPEQQLEENATLPTVTSQPPTPPPPLPYLRYFSTIPALRNKGGME